MTEEKSTYILLKEQRMSLLQIPGLFYSKNRFFFQWLTSIKIE